MYVSNKNTYTCLQVIGKVKFASIAVGHFVLFCLVVSSAWVLLENLKTRGGVENTRRKVKSQRGE